MNMRMKIERRCILISVLMVLRYVRRFSLKTVVFFLLSSLATGFTYIWRYFKKQNKTTCGKGHKNPLCRRNKSRYQSASLTVETAVAFPVFFFAVWYLLQMFLILRAELVIAEAGITSARSAAAFAYVGERLADGETAVAEKLLALFDQKLIRDAAFTGIFYTACDGGVLKRGNVAQGIGGMWVDTIPEGDKTKLHISYRVKPDAAFVPKKAKYYCQNLVYRNWTGEGGGKAVSEEGRVAYLSDTGTVYHLDKNCSYIKRTVTGVSAQTIGTKRNASGAKYYACEFCEPVLKSGVSVYITAHGTRYHMSSSCSAIKRSPRSCPLEEAKAAYKACSRCGTSEEKGEE